MSKNNKQRATQGSMALWIMTPFGVLMPAALPPEVAADQPEGTLQVRARDAAHLDHFREHWCPELQETVKTPKMDYDARALVGAEDLARAVARMTLSVSAWRFKPTTGGPDGLADKGKANRLHAVYLKVWGAVTGLSDKQWPSSSSVKISQPDPNASSEMCQQEGHLWPIGSAGGKVRVVHCNDPACDALKNTYTHKIHYPKSHVTHLPEPGSPEAGAFVDQLAGRP